MNNVKESIGCNKLPWSERVNMLSINPDAATIEDIAMMATELSEISSIDYKKLSDEFYSVIAHATAGSDLWSTDIKLAVAACIAEVKKEIAKSM